MQSSDKITLSGICSDNPHLGKLWGGVFYHPTFVDAAAHVLRLKGQSSIINHEGEPVGAINLLYRERTGFRTATTPLLFQYFGPTWFESGNAKNSVASQIDLDEYLKCHFDFAYFSLPPNPSSVLSFDKYHHLKAVTLALQGDRLLKWGENFRDDVKNKINKAKKEKVQIDLAESLPESLWEMTFGRRGASPPIKPSALADWCRSLVSVSLLKIYLAQIDNRPVAFRGELLYGDFAYDWIAGSDPAFHASGANQLLMAEIGREFSSKNIHAWDLVGGDIKSIADFKKSFGAIEIPHDHIHRSYNFKGQIFNILRNIRHGRE